MRAPHEAASRSEVDRPGPTPAFPCVLVALAFGFAAGAQAQENVIHAEEYLVPSAGVAQAVTAPRHQVVSLTNLSPDGRYFLHQEGVNLPALADLARPHRNLAGLYVDVEADRNRNLTIRGSERLELLAWEDGTQREIAIPEGARASGATWSPDGSRIAFLATYPDQTHLYVADVGTGGVERISPRPLLATRVTSPAWSGDGRFVYAVLVPEGRGAEPRAPASPMAPMVRVAADEENRLRTFPTLLRTPHDRELLDHYITGQLARVEVDGGRVEELGAPSRIEMLDPAPDGEHVRVRTTREPFSYIVALNSFGDREEVWNFRGESLAVLRERDPRKGASGADDDEEEEKRALEWRPDGRGLGFLQSEPESDDDEEGRGDRKDRVMLWVPPFGDDDVEVVYESENRIREVRYSEDARVLFLTEREGGEEHLFAVFLDEPEERHTIYRHDSDDRLAHPGSLAIRTGEGGTEVVRISSDGRDVYLSGTKRAEDPLEEAPRAFLDRVEIRTGESERLFESAEDALERVTAILDDDAGRVVVTRESPTEVPNGFVRDLRSGEERQVTENQDPTPELTAARREYHRVTRTDGVEFTMQVTLPADWDGEPLPGMIWFYPREYEDQDALDDARRNLNVNRYPSIGPRSAEIFALAGYAVLQPDHPIVGPLDRVNDNYVTDLQANHLAVIDAADRLGYVDRSRMSLGGHSYGGFGTINAMVRTPYFRAGIAGAPNSNRLLTPMGFQRERRLLWESRETYLELSPFLWAERLQGALLIYHGDDDQNTGTFPDNSWRLFHALNGLGKTAALYMYPYEGHGPAAEETVLDMWARWIAWLDYYVRDAEEGTPPRPVAAQAEEPDGDH